MDYRTRSLRLHRKLKGKVEVTPKTPVNTRQDLSLVYTPGVAEACLEITRRPEAAFDLTIKSNTVAIISDGSAVLGLGNIGPEAALPVMEGKAMLFKKFAGLNAFPICLRTQDVDEIVSIVKALAPTFGAVNLEDISAPRCFEIESRLQDIGIPVMHDDQHGTAIVVRAALINAAKVVGKKFEDLSVVVNGAGAAGIAIAHILGLPEHASVRTPRVRDITVCDSRGVIGFHRKDLNGHKEALVSWTNGRGVKGSLAEALVGADVCIGVSQPGVLKPEMIKTMAQKPIVCALANPIPEIMPDEARKAGAVVVATGRSDFPNQVNNALAFPGVFQGALSIRAKKITLDMKIAAAEALAKIITRPTKNKILPSIFDRQVVKKVAEAVRRVA